MSLRCVYGLRAYNFPICHCAESNKILEATIPVNPYDDRNVILRRSHGNGDLDIVRVSYTCRKANVTEALVSPCQILNASNTFLLGFFTHPSAARQVEQVLTTFSLGQRRCITLLPRSTLANAALSHSILKL